jgi:hypothetical protein
MLKVLLDISKVNINRENTHASDEDDKYNTALMYAMSAQQILNAELLLSCGAKIVNSKGENAFDCCPNEKFRTKLIAHYQKITPPEKREPLGKLHCPTPSQKTTEYKEREITTNGHTSHQVIYAAMGFYGEKKQQEQAAKNKQVSTPSKPPTYADVLKRGNNKKGH